MSSESPKIKEETNKEPSPSKSTAGDVKNRGWPKGKKRYPKSPGAPKQPLSGYVHFLNDRRESVRKEEPDISFAGRKTIKFTLKPCAVAWYLV